VRVGPRESGSSRVLCPAPHASPARSTNTSPRSADRPSRSTLKLPEPVQELVEREVISAAAAYEVSKLEDPTLQAEVAQAAVAEGLKRSEVAALVQAVKARRPAPKARPEPITIDLGDGCTVTVRWKKAGELTATQALRKALKALQEQEAKGRGEAA
jgi:hypothetical protein